MVTETNELPTQCVFVQFSQDLMNHEFAGMETQMNALGIKSHSEFQNRVKENDEWDWALDLVTKGFLSFRIKLTEILQPDFFMNFDDIFYTHISNTAGTFKEEGEIRNVLCFGFWILINPDLYTNPEEIETRIRNIKNYFLSQDYDDCLMKIKLLTLSKPIQEKLFYKKNN